MLNTSILRDGVMFHIMMTVQWLAVVIDERPITPCVSNILSPTATANDLIEWCGKWHYYGVLVKSAGSDYLVIFVAITIFTHTLHAFF